MRVLFLISAFLLIYIGAYSQANTTNNNTVVVKIKSYAHKSSTTELFSDFKQVTNDEIQNIEPFINSSQRKKQIIPKKYDLSSIYKITIKNSHNLNKIISKLNKLTDVIYAEPYPIAHVFDSPNDPLNGNQYYIQNTKVFEAHEICKGDTNIVIGIVDSGVDLLHEDLKDNYKYNYNDPINNIDDDGDGYVDNYYGWDVADKDPNPQSLVNIHGESNYHGTKVAGMASASTNNNIGISSMGYKTKLMPIKAMDASGNISAGYEGIVYAADHGCAIINCSWGNNVYSQFAQDVINYAAIYRGCLIVAAAGNTVAATDDRPDTWFYPASYNNVLSVAATGPTDERWSGSSYGIKVDVSAPGEGTYSTKQLNTYGAGSGTSYASPLVAGLAGLIKAHNPHFTQKQLTEQIRITSDNIDTIPENTYYSNQLGYGRINAFRALTIDYLPSLRIDSIKVTSNKKANLLNGDTLSVSFIATNYLAQATNTTIRLTSNSEHLTPIKNIISTGALNTFEMVSNTTIPFTFALNENIPYNEKIWLKFEMKDQGYDDYQIFELPINKDFITITEKDISTTLTSNGKIGYANRLEELGIGLEYKGNNLLSDAGIILGRSSTLMVSSLYDVEDFTPKTLVDTLRTPEGILMSQSEFYSNSELGIDINITHTALFPNENDLQSTIIHLYNLKNPGTESVDQLKMSQFIDWDINYSYSNKVDFLANLNMAYTYSTGNNITYAGICLLNNMSTIPYGFDLSIFGGGVDITQGFGNDLKWITMTNRRDSAGNNTSGLDVASMLTTDFFNIDSGDSIEIAFAHIIGNNLNEIALKAETLIENYNKISDVQQRVNSLKVYPNPASNTLYIQCENAEYAYITIYDQHGKIIKTYKKESAVNNLVINIELLESGIYFINLATNKNSTTTKFIKIAQ
ncbi:MAG: S8 family peptidase [Salinivirgaceae bacterium]|jgi:serine protease|nr:S8 family peptidase [Salinivirgaceae bacterium]